MPTYKTPAVYVEEIPKLPPSVAEVSTAIPAFIGYTEKAPPAGSLARVTSMLEYRELFGGPQKAKFTVTEGTLAVVRDTSAPQFLLYYAIQHYFKNGGGPCYIVSAGTYGAEPPDKVDKDLLRTALDKLEEEDEPTLLVQTDAVNVANTGDYHALCVAALVQCNKLRDRFAIFDVKQTTESLRKDAEVFREGIGQEYLAYGAAYYPYLRTLLSYEYEESDVTILPPDPWTLDLSANSIRAGYAGAGTAPKSKVVQGTKPGLDFSTEATTLTIALGTETAAKTPTGKDVIAAWKAWTEKNDPKGFTITQLGTGEEKLAAGAETALRPPPWSKELSRDSLKVTFTGAAGTPPTVKVVVDPAATAPFAVGDRALTITVKDATATGASVVGAWTAWKADTTHDPQGFEITKLGSGNDVVAAWSTTLRPGRTLESIRTRDTALYNKIKAKLADERVTLPPSATVAGIYARVDRDRGVWKAPANASVMDTSEPARRVTDADQEDLNVHTTGKSINVIRSFAGKGTLVWGARTLAGNDNEWRYIPVRRLFIMIEESTKKATSFAVFEPNDMTTWLKVKGMIESFLYNLWERGALAGPTPAAAYYVNVGLGKTMTTQDILEGRLIVEIGIAAVRPAEFIILRFSHKLQEA